MHIEVALCSLGEGTELSLIFARGQKAHSFITVLLHSTTQVLH